MLKNINIVLVDPLYGGNIGAVARIMKNMGLNRLSLVCPRQFPGKDATMFSAKAADILDKAQVYDSLDQALQGCSNVIGTSSRSRRLPINSYPLRAGAQKIIKLIGDGKEKTAILFGSEDRGLTNDELLRCRMHIFIPTDMQYQALNLAAAAQIVCYELLCAVQSLQNKEMLYPLQDGKINQSNRLLRHKNMPLADHNAMEGFYAHLEEWLCKIRFFNPQKPITVMQKMRRIFNRIPLYANEVDMLRGVIKQSLGYTNPLEENKKVNNLQTKLKKYND